MSEIHEVGVHEAKTHFSRLLREVEGGGEVLVTRGGRPVARIVSAGSPASFGDSFGMFAGQMRIHGDFDADADVLADDFGIQK